MSNHHLSNAHQKDGASTHITPTGDPHPFVTYQLLDGSPVKVLASQALSMPIVKKDVLISSSEGTSSVLQSNTCVNFRIPAGSVDFVHSAALIMNITNNTGNNLKLVPAPLLIDYIEILANNGGLSVQRIYGDTIFLDYNHLTSEDLQKVARTANMSTSWGGGSTINTGTSVTYIVPFHSLFDTCEPFLAGCDSDWVVKVYMWGGLSKIVEETQSNATEAPPTMTSMQLLLHCRELPPAMRERRIAEYKNKNVEAFTHKFMRIVNQHFQQVFNASTKYTFTLNAANSVTSHAVVLLRSSKNAAGMRTYQVIGEFNFQDSSGKSITGLPTILSDVNRSLHSRDFPGALQYNHPVYIQSWGEPRHAIESGVMLGAYAFGGREQLTITTAPSGSHTNGSFTLDVYTYEHAALHIHGGFVTVTNS